MNLLERFPKYSPSSELDAYMLASVTGMRVDKEQRIMEVDISSSLIIPKRYLFRIESEIQEVYKLNHFKIFPKYPPEAFNDEYFEDLIFESYKMGIISKGFFEDYTIVTDDDVKIIKVPFLQSGIDMLDASNTGNEISKIISDEFGLNIKVKIEQREDYKRNIEAFEAEKLNILKKALEGQKTASSNNTINKEEETQKLYASFEKATTLSKEEIKITKNDNEITIGPSTYIISNPEYVTGGLFEIKSFVPIRNLKAGMNGICVLGTVFNIEEKVIKSRKNGNITILSVGFTDKDASINIQITINKETPEEVKTYFKKGDSYAVIGNVKVDEFNKDKEIYLDYTDIQKITKKSRTDNAETKRVELHCHTTMSAKDAIIAPDELIARIKEWGHKTVAITDHGNVQGFPPIMEASEKAGIKVIYGMEAYFVDDTAKAIYGDKSASFSDEFCVFDIETTGLSLQRDKITEIGAVIVKNGEVIKTYDSFVNPHMEIPENIVELTHITNEMVADARDISEVLPEFFEFVGDRILVAHNASFDTGFVRKASEDCGLSFGYTYLDTLALSKFVNPDLKKHKLDILAEYYNLGDFNHHRACDDSEMLAYILSAMFEKLKGDGIEDTEKMVQEMSVKVDPKKLPVYHQILLVKNKIGLKNLYRLISESYLTYFKRSPRIPKTLLQEYREGLIIGSACEAGELFRAILDCRSDAEIDAIADFYDYLEIQPLCNNMFLVNENKATKEDLINYNKRIVALGEKLGKPVVATCDAHFLNKEDEIGRKILLASSKFKDADKDTGIYFRTTEEMLEEFSYLGEEKAYEIVVTNTNKIADMIDYDNIRPFPKGTFTPKMEGAEEDLQNMCWERARNMYAFNGEIPTVVSERLEKELTSIISNGFAVLYMIAQKLVYQSENLGYLVGSRGSVGSSFVATMAGISEVNPLQPHYRCPNCKYSEFITDGSVGSGFDLPEKNCPHCDSKMVQDGHDIPFETFLGFKGDKSPDIDLNFSGDVQGEIHKYTENLFGKENVFRAGTIGEVAEKTAIGYILKYMEEHETVVNSAEMKRLAGLCTGVKRTTGQHPGGIVVVPKEYEIYDFCPVQHPADDPDSDIVTTHFTFSYLHDTLLKLDELGHDIPTKYKMLEEYSNTSVLDVPMNDPEVYELFLSTRPFGDENLLKDLKCNVGTYGLPEFGTKFVQQMLEDAKPKNFSDLLQISGLSHGTDVWLGNAQDLIKKGICTISEVVGTRDSIMLYLIYNGLEKGMAFKIMEDVRKGKGLKPEYEAAMKENNIPDWYMDSCKKIKYMFPKAHAAAYVISAIRLGWYKVHMPLVFYAAYLSVAPGGFESSMVEGGRRGVLDRLAEIDEKIKANTATQKDKETVTALQMVYECLARNIEFLPVDLMKSDSFKFLPENGKIRMPFSSIDGVGENAAIKIKEARDSNEIFSVEDFQQKTMLSKAVMETLEQNHVFDNLAKTNQMSLFDLL